jgi:hypothetical protein
MKIQFVNRAPIEPAAPEPTPAERLAELDTEERRWEGLFEGTTIPTDRIIEGIHGVRERRQALLESQLPNESQT